MNAQEICEGLALYLGYGQSAWPRADETALYERFGSERGAKVKDAILEILAVLNAMESDWSALEAAEAARCAARQTVEKFPFLDVRAQAALAWKYSFDWR